MARSVSQRSGRARPGGPAKLVEPPGSRNRYTGAALRRLLERAGFEVLEFRSQRPHDDLTRLAHRVANRTMARYFGDRPAWKRRIGQLYEDLTGVEVFALARRAQGRL